MTDSNWNLIKCPICGRAVRGYVPAGGDGTALRPYRHLNLATGAQCKGRLHTIFEWDPAKAEFDTDKETNE